MKQVLNTYLNHYKGIPKNCWKGVSLTFLNDVSGCVVFFLSFYFVNSLHLNVAVASSIISFYGVGLVLGGIVGGRMADSFSPKKVAMISLFLKGILFFILIFLKTVYPLIINIFMLGFVNYSFRAANNTLTLSYCGQDEAIRLRMIGIIYAATNLGIGIAAIIIGILEHYSFHLIFLASSLLLIFACIYFGLQSEENKSAVVTAVKTHGEVSKITNKRPMFIALLCLFLVGLVMSQLFTTYSIFLHQIFPGFGGKAVGVLFAINSGMIVFLQTPLVNLVKQKNKLVVMAVGALLFGLGMMMLNFSFLFLIAMLACIIFTIGEMLFISMTQSVIYESGAANKKGRCLGYYQSTFACSMIAGPALGGLVYHYFSGEMVWYISGLIGFICFILCLLECNKN